MPAPISAPPTSGCVRVGFKKLLHNPIAVNPGTRMPAFWDKGDVTFKDLGGGTEEWADRLDLGLCSRSANQCRLPAGLAPAGGYELVPTDEPIVHRTFMAESARGRSPSDSRKCSTLHSTPTSCGSPEAWHGRFFDAKGMWDGRGGQSLGPLGTDVINLPPGPVICSACLERRRLARRPNPTSAT